jgi:DNA polymerase-3 subunit delta
VRSALLGREIREADLLPAYFFYGEELFQAEQFIRDLQRALVSPEVQGISLERFELSENRWRDILDVARTIAFFFSPWRLLVVAIEDAEDEDMTGDEQKILAEYLASPTPKTILIVLFYGKIRKTKPLYKAFSSLPKSTVHAAELKVLKNERLIAWVDGKLAALDKRASSEAIDRLVEMTGNNLQQLDSELDKLATYVGDKKLIDVADVNLLSVGVREFEDWALSDSLELGDYEECLKIIHKRFQEGDKPELAVLYQISNHFRDLLLTKSLLREKKDRREVFRAVRPGILETYGDLYRRKFRSLFGAIERIAHKDLVRLVTRLEQLDLKLKTTDTSPQALFESFIFDYCRPRK